MLKIVHLFLLIVPCLKHFSIYYKAWSVTHGYLFDLLASWEGFYQGVFESPNKFCLPYFIFSIGDSVNKMQ